MLKRLKSCVKRRYPALVDVYRTVVCTRRDLRDLCDMFFKKSRATPYGFTLLGSNSVHHRAMQAGTFEPEETALIQQHLSRAEVFIDVGANIGFYTCIARSAGKRVVAVEPLAKNLVYLYRNLTINDWSDCEVCPVGLSAQAGLVMLYGASGTGASLISGWAGASPRFRRMIPVSTLDTVVGERFAGKKLLIKVDVEGNEYHVVLGSRKTMGMSPPPTWMIEICLSEYHPAGLNPNYAAIFKMFWEHGYEVRTANLQGRVIYPADVERWVNARCCDSGVINYIFRPMA